MAEKKAPGPKPKFNKASSKELCVLVLLGVPMPEACAEFGWSEKTVYQWLLDDRYPEFTDMYERARAMSGHPLLDVARRLIEDEEQQKDPFRQAARVNTILNYVSRLAPNGGRKSAPARERRGKKEAKKRPSLVLLPDNGRRTGHRAS